MNRDYFVEKVLRGEQVALVDVIKSNAESELDAIYSEADARRAAQQIHLDAEIRQEAALTELLTLDSEAETLYAELLALDEKRAEATRALDERELAIRAELSQKRLKFDLEGRFFTGGEPFDMRNPQVLKAVEFLRGRGAKIDAITISIHQTALSYSARILASNLERQNTTNESK